MKRIALLLIFIVLAGCINGGDGKDKNGVPNTRSDDDWEKNLQGMPSQIPSVGEKYCNKIEYNELKRNWCLAIANIDESYCEKMSECELCASSWKENKVYLPDMASCYRDIARLKKDDSLCAVIEGLGLKKYDQHKVEDCYELVEFDGEDKVFINYELTIPDVDVSSCLGKTEYAEARDCLAVAAIQAEDALLCSTKIPGLDSQDQNNVRVECYEIVGVGLHDASICEKSGWWDVGTTAVELKSVCKRLSYEYNPDNISPANITKKCSDVSVTRTLVKGWKEGCHSHYAGLKGYDSEYCQGKLGCLKMVALEKNDASVCGDLSTCWWDLAWEWDDFDLCLQNPSDESMRNCVTRFAYENKDPGLCEHLSGGVKNSCYIIAMRGVMGYEKFVKY